MRQPKLIDYILLTFLALIWASAFFNIKIATYSYGPITIANGVTFTIANNSKLKILEF